MPVIAFVDVDYRGLEAVAACVLAARFDDASPAAEWSERIARVEPYQPGAFYKRELPCLLAVLRVATQAPSTVTTVVIDGYVWLAPGRPGLGAHLHEALGGMPVIGVAKAAFAGSVDAVPLLRGESERPLYITAVGMEVADAARSIASMHGTFRIPTLLQRVDRLSRAA